MAILKKKLQDEKRRDSNQAANTDIIHLSERDSIAVINSLRYPPKLTPAMQSLLQKHYPRA